MTPIKAPVGTGKYSLTEPAVLTFPQLFEAKAIGKKGRESGKPKFSMGTLYSPDSLDLRAMKKIAVSVANIGWPGRSLQELKFPFAMGDKLADARLAETGKNDSDFQRGKVVLSSRSIHKPMLSLIENGRVTDLSNDDARLAAKAKFYFGVHVLCTFNFVAYEGIGNNPDGVTCYIDLIASLNKGEKLGSTGHSAANAFTGYIGKSSTIDPTAGHASAGNEDIPL